MIYFIDGDISVLRAFELFLQSAGMEYRSFKNTDSFLLEVQPTVNDLVVMDLSMVGKVACEVLKKFYKDNNQIPVIVLTVTESDELRECCRQFGVKAIMRKPVDGEALIDLIKYSLLL
jgi:FixJ family two-component response regulator